MPKRLLALVLVAAAVATATLLPVGTVVRELSATLQSTGAAGMLAYIGVYALLTVLMVPGSALTLLAGLVYGLGAGLLVVIPGSVLGATLAALLGRTLLRAAVVSRLAAYPRWAAIDRAIARDGFKIVLLTRLSPVLPFTLLNYGLGVTGVGMGRYVLASAIGMFPGTVAYVYLGTLIPGVTQLLEGGAPAAEGSAARTGLLILGAVATLVLAGWLARIAKRALDDVEETSPQGAEDAAHRAPDPDPAPEADAARTDQ